MPFWEEWSKLLISWTKNEKYNLTKYHISKQAASLEFSDTATTKIGHLQNAIEHIKKNFMLQTVYKSM